MIYAENAQIPADWGKSLHTGDEQFQGSSEVSWSELDSQGSGSTWNNDSFKDQNAIEAESDYVGSLESSTVSVEFDGDSNTSTNNEDIANTEFIN